MSSPPQASKGAQTRAKLLRAASEELVETGGHLEVAAVARRAGTSIGLTYRYFHNKGALAAAVVEDFFDRLDEAVMHAPIEAPDWAGRERKRIQLMVAFHFAEPLAAVALGALAREPEVAAVLVDRNAQQAAMMAGNLARGQDLGQVSQELDPTIAGPMMMGAIRDALRVGLTAGEHLGAATLTNEILRFVSDACGIPPGAPLPEPTDDDPA